MTKKQQPNILAKKKHTEGLIENPSSVTQPVF